MKAPYISGCGVSTTDKIPLETLSSIPPNFMMLQIILKSFLASLCAPAGLLSTRKQIRFPLGIALWVFPFPQLPWLQFLLGETKTLCGKTTGTLHFITQYLRGDVAILSKFNKREENRDPVHFKIDKKRVVILLELLKKKRISSIVFYKQRTAYVIKYRDVRKFCLHRFLSHCLYNLSLLTDLRFLSVINSLFFVYLRFTIIRSVGSEV